MAPRFFAVSRATASADKLPADPPETKHPPDVVGMPASWAIVMPSATVLADRFDGTPFNSPNDVVQHPDGSYWFTDPSYGGQLYEGAPDASGGIEL